MQPDDTHTAHADSFDVHKVNPTPEDLGYPRSSVTVSHDADGNCHFVDAAGVVQIRCDESDIVECGIDGAGHVPNRVHKLDNGEL
jgi:hypothetical protein